MKLYQFFNGKQHFYFRNKVDFIRYCRERKVPVGKRIADCLDVKCNKDGVLEALNSVGNHLSYFVISANENATNGDSESFEKKVSFISKPCVDCGIEIIKSDEFLFRGNGQHIQPLCNSCYERRKKCFDKVHGVICEEEVVNG